MADVEMYSGMEKSNRSIKIDHAIALHKMIRLITLTLASEAYLNFMGNEFGHPEWIDFPREGNSWSYKYARRQWSLSKNSSLKYEWLENFDREMLRFVRKYCVLIKNDTVNLWVDQNNKVLAYAKGGLIYVFNFSPDHSQTDFFFPSHATGEGQYRAVFSTDESSFGGEDRISQDYIYTAKQIEGKGLGFNIYTPARSAVVFKPVAE